MRDRATKSLGRAARPGPARLRVLTASVTKRSNERYVERRIDRPSCLGDRHFDDVQDLEYDVGNARIWGGIHFRTAVEDGVTIGKKTAHQVLAHNFQTSP